jgi:hypothetical protein
MVKDGVLYSISDYCHYEGVSKTKLAETFGMSRQSLTRYINNDWYSVRRTGNELELISTKIVKTTIVKEG